MIPEISERKRETWLWGKNISARGTARGLRKWECTQHLPGTIRRPVAAGVEWRRWRQVRNEVRGVQVGSG